MENEKRKGIYFDTPFWFLLVYSASILNETLNLIPFAEPACKTQLELVYIPFLNNIRDLLTILLRIGLLKTIPVLLSLIYFKI